VTCLTRFTQLIDLYDGRDLRSDIVNGRDWKVGRNLHELISCLPDFIRSTKIQEDHAQEEIEVNEAKSILNPGQAEKVMAEVYGNYNLETVYDLSHFQNVMTEDGTKMIKGRFADSCKVFHCLEQAESGEGYIDRVVVVTNSCVLVFTPLK